MTFHSFFNDKDPTNDKVKESDLLINSDVNDSYGAGSSGAAL